MFQWKGFKISPPLQTTQKGSNKSTNNNIWTFWQVSFPMGLNSTKKWDLEKKWTILFYETNIPFNVVWHPMFIEIMRATLNLEPTTNTHHIPWITHKFVKAIQDGRVQIGNQEDMKFDSQIWNNHLLWWLGQHCTTSITECNVCLSKWWCIHRFH